MRSRAMPVPVLTTTRPPDVSHGLALAYRGMIRKKVLHTGPMLISETCVPYRLEAVKHDTVHDVGRIRPRFSGGRPAFAFSISRSNGPQRRSASTFCAWRA
jgi:hypothetical protein